MERKQLVFTFIKVLMLPMKLTKGGHLHHPEFVQ